MARPRTTTAGSLREPGWPTWLPTVRAAIGNAVMTDPIVQSHLSLDDAWRLTDAMIEAEAEWLPEWLTGTTTNATMR